MFPFALWRDLLSLLFLFVQVLAHLMEHTVEEGQSMCLVASSWWSYWSTYAALTKQDVLRVPERLALGLHKTEGYLDQAPADEPLAAMGVVQVAGGDAKTTSRSSPDRAVGGGGAASGAASGAGGNGNGHGHGNGHAAREAQALESFGGAGKERAVPTMLARRPHEIDNSSLQVKGGRCDATQRL